MGRLLLNPLSIEVAVNEDKFIQAYVASRNGTDNFYFNRLYPKFFYSDGVKECAEAGCYWLVDTLGTELPAEFKKRSDYSCSISVVVDEDAQCTITGSFFDGDPDPYIKHIEYTDMPQGTWNFYVTVEEGGIFRCILLTEY